MKEIVSLFQYLLEHPVATFTTIMAVSLIVIWFVFWMTKKVTRLSTAQEFLEKDHALLRDSIVKLSEKMENISISINHLSNKMDARFEQVNERFEQVDRRFEQVDERFEQIDRRFEQVDERFEQIDRRFEQVDKRFEQVDKRFEQVDKRFERMDKKIEDLSDQLHKNTMELRSDIAYMKGEMNGTRSRSIPLRWYEPKRKVVRR